MDEGFGLALTVALCSLTAVLMVLGLRSPDDAQSLLLAMAALTAVVGMTVGQRVAASRTAREPPPPASIDPASYDPAEIDQTPRAA